MSNTEATPTQQTDRETWTLMFFLASDNSLSPSTLPQIKAIKAAGSQADTNVLVYFDPNEKGAPTRVFEINRDQRGGGPTSSSATAPAVSVLAGDAISPDEMLRLGTESRKFGTSLKERSDKLKADEALEQFLGFCRETYAADHYMLFLLGHGLVVGRDAFLPDDNPESAIGLKRLGEILQGFSGAITNQRQVLELIGMHSCSMSAIEVAYELNGTASYMLGSQGLSFVGSWPYRQFLTEIYRAVGTGAVDVPNLAKSLHTLCVGYSVDFMYAGYSCDVCLCSLDPQRVRVLNDPISKLSQALENGVRDPRCRDLIVLAHWKSQSYWQETYTDLYDFCHCLRELCKQPKKDRSDENAPQFGHREYDANRLKIIEACDGVISKLTPENGSVTGPIVCTDFVGPDVQYSHGLSIYFPWSRPVQDKNDHVLDNYEGYAFTSALNRSFTWKQFLNSYFDDTLRKSRVTEEVNNPKYQDSDYQRALMTARQNFETATTATSRDFYPTSTLEGKVTPPDSGGGCSCASTRNYSREFAMSPGASTVFSRIRTRTASAPGSGGSSGTP